MRRTAVDPASLEGQELDRWYRRTPDEIAEERAARQQYESDKFYGATPWREARATPPAIMIRPPPVASPAEGPPLEAGGSGTFFGEHAPIPGTGFYPTPLPPPLNRVEQSSPDWRYYFLGGEEAPVTADEVERINAEQRRRTNGDYSPGQKKVRIEDRLPNGVVPGVMQLEKGVHEADPTCHPNGGWEIDPGFSKYPKLAQDYEAQVTRGRGIDYVVRVPGQNPVKFDGCAVWSPRRELLEAKGPRYAGLFARAWRSTFGQFVADGLTEQAGRQAKVAGPRPIDWHVAEKEAEEQIGKAAMKGAPRIRIVLDPLRPE